MVAYLSATVAHLPLAVVAAAAAVGLLMMIAINLEVIIPIIRMIVRIIIVLMEMFRIMI